MYEVQMNEYIEPNDLGLKTTVKVVSGNIIETVRNSRFNVVTLLYKHPYFHSLGLNEFDRLVYWKGKPIDDNQLSRMATWMESLYDVRPSVALMLECVNQVAEDKKFNPLAEYFKNKKWDGNRDWKHSWKIILERNPVLLTVLIRRSSSLVPFVARYILPSKNL